MLQCSLVRNDRKTMVKLFKIWIQTGFGHENISIKIFGLTICRPLEIILKEALSTGFFPLEWKKVLIKK